MMLLAQKESMLLSFKFLSKMWNVRCVVILWSSWAHSFVMLVNLEIIMNNLQVWLWNVSKLLEHLHGMH